MTFLCSGFLDSSQVVTAWYGPSVFHPNSESADRTNI